MKLISSSNAQQPGSEIVWDQVTTIDLGGVLNVTPPVNPQGLMGQAWVDVDQNTGDIYVLASVTRNDESGDPSDVMFARSSDGGASFSPPVRVNTDPGTEAYQWFGTMSVAPNGRIDAVWLDTRDADNQIDSVLYYSYSEDGGLSWETEEAISPSFDPSIGYPQQNKMGDYFDMVSDDEAAHLAWVNTINGGQDVYYSRISPQILSSPRVLPGLTRLDIYPNPFSDRLHVDLDLDEPSTTSIKVYNLLGQEVTSIIDAELSGIQKLVWNAGDQVAGLYLVEISINGIKEVRKVLLQ
ncbi:T9SS type A sorting domain-containing protein [Aureitalea marina]